MSYRLSNSHGSQRRSSSSKADRSTLPPGARPSRVKVVVRVRPVNAADETSGRSPEELMVGARISEDSKRVTLTRPLFEDRMFVHDAVLGPQTVQEDMYEVVGREIVDGVLEGFNGTIIAYGQTGSGKTYTIFGPEETVDRAADPEYFQRCGVIPRSIDHLFERIHALNGNTEFRVSISCLEMYMEYVMDLFDMEKTNLSVREDPTHGVFVDQMTHVVVQSPFDALFLVQEAFKNRAISRTYMNKTSSRSHVIVFITVEQRDLQVGGNSDASVKRGLLTIVDLAGSERVSKSRSDGQRLREAKKINGSLCALGNCVAALAERSNTRHIPYRDSKLTRILTDSLGGNTKTCLCATICPTVYNYEESTSTLLFAKRAMSVRNHARINTDTHFRVVRQGDEAEVDEDEVSVRDRGDERSHGGERGDHQQSPERTRRGSTGNDDLAREVQRLRQENEEMRANWVEKKSIEEMWQLRERELVGKFTTIIQHMQTEIKRQSQLFDSIGRQQGLSQGQALIRGLDGIIDSQKREDGSQRDPTDSDIALEQLVAGLLSIPSIRNKLTERLGDDDIARPPASARRAYAQ